MTEEHVPGSQSPSGSEPPADDASKLAALEAQVAALTENVQKRDDALKTMQSDRDKLQAKLEREQRQRERVEAARVKDVGKLSTNDQTAYLQTVAAQEHQKATRFELAFKYNLDPTELEGDFESPEAMKLKAMELAQKRDTGTMEQRLDKLTELVTQLADLQQKQQQETPPPPTTPVTPDVGGRTGRRQPAAEDLSKFDQVAEEAAKKGDHETAVAAKLARIHRDPTKVMGPARSTEPLPPELQERMRR